jgi:hypothetical protein
LLRNKQWRRKYSQAGDAAKNRSHGELPPVSIWRTIHLNRSR